MQAAAKQFRGDFFVAIDQPVGKFVRIEAPFLNGDVGVRGDAIAMPAVRNGRKGLVIRLVRLDPDSLGIPIQESSKALGIEDDDDAVEEFDSSQSTVASGVSAAVAKSIRAAGSAAPVKPMTASPSPPAGVPKAVTKTPSQPTKLEDLDDEAREAVNEFGEASTRASELSADLAKQLAEPPPAAAHAVRRVTPESGVPKQVQAPKGLPDLPPGADDDAGLDSAFSDVSEEITDSPPNAVATNARAEVPEFDLDGSEPTPEPAEPAKVKQADDAAKAKPSDDQDESGAEADEPARETPPKARSAAKAETRTDIVDKLPASAPVAAKTSKSQLVVLIVLIIIAAGAGIALWRGII
jgi:hypothetical protein